MNILVLTGSPHKKGTSALMADNFIKGAIESGHRIYRFDAAFKKVHPCIGCDKCASGKNSCVFQDDMTELYQELLNADMVVYISPLYYHDISAQMKTVIDRYHGIDDLIRNTGKRAMLILTAASSEDWIFEGVKSTYQTTLRYLGWTDCGGILAYGCYRREDIEKTDYPKQAYELGNSIEKELKL